MGVEKEHLSHANRTQKTIKHLLSDPAIHSPWIAIAAFYKSLHIVEAVFSSDRAILHTSDHGERAKKLKSERKFMKIVEHYLPLERAGWNARYIADNRAFDAWCSPEEVVSDLLKHHLRQLEKSAKRLLKQPDELVGIETIFP